MSVLNNEPCMVRPILIDMNPVGIKYYPLMINLYKCSGRCNILSPNICVPKETTHPATRRRGDVVFTSPYTS